MTSAPPLPLAPPRSAVTVVVLTWNGRRDTLALLDSLCPQLDAADHVVVVDNGSGDGTEAEVRARFPQVTLLQNGGNLGFAGGNNPGLRAALACGTEWILVLNNDTVLETGTLAALLSGADAARAADDRLGAVQPVLVRADASATIDSCGQLLCRLPGAKDLGAGGAVGALPGAPTPIFGACGAATLLHRDALAAVGGYDASLFVLFEDTDLAFRIRAAGFTAVLLPTVRIRHARGVSHGRDATGRRLRAFWVQRNIVTLALRWWPTGSLLRAVPVLLWRMLHALTLGCRLRQRPCAGLWLRALRERAALRRRLRACDGDLWFGLDPLGTPPAAR